MAKGHLSNEEQKPKVRKPESHEQDQERAGETGPQAPLLILQQTIGNQAVQRLIAQCSGDAFELDDETAGRIGHERSGGQPLDATFQQQAAAAMGHDFGGVRVHASPESDALNRQLGAKAFTTGQDIFFREGAYEPHTSGGRELIGHELTHVVQQSTGAVGSGSGRMTVNAPGDAFEQEADAVAGEIAHAGPAAGAEVGVQRQANPEEEEEEESLQMQAAEEEEEEELP